MSKRRLKLTQSSALRSKLVEAGTRKVALTLEDTNPFAKRPNLAADVVELRRRKAAQLMAGYYSGTLRALQGVLDNPGAPVTLAPASFRFHRNVDVSVGNHGSRMPQTESIRLESGVTTNSKWEGLGPNYAAGVGRWKGLPVSRTFWRKTGKLRDAYNAWFASQQARLQNPRSYYAGNAKNITGDVNKFKRSRSPVPGYGFSAEVGAFIPKGTKRVLGRWQIFLKHPELSNPILDTLIRSPYVYGKARAFDLKANRDNLVSGTRQVDVTYTKGRLKGQTIPREVKIRTEGLSRMGLAEARRPMISRFARAAGQRELEALRKLLKR